MSFPAASVRTKDWGSEVLTDSDLEAQFDILHSYLNDSLDGTTGHAHTGADGDGAKINLQSGVTSILNPPNGGTGQSAYTIGDILYASSTTGLSVINAGELGQALCAGGAGTPPTYSGMSIQGDIDYHDGVGRQKLAAGTAGQFLMTGGAGADPSWQSVVGASVNKVAGTIYQAATDGFFIGIIIANTDPTFAEINGYTDASASPATLMGTASVYRNDGGFSRTYGVRKQSFMFPVRKGNYYQGVTTYDSSGANAPSVSFYFIPIGA